MIDTGYAEHAEILLRHIEAVPGYAGLIGTIGSDIDISRETLAMILSSAASFAERELAPLNSIGDRAGCRIEDGRVCTPPGYVEAWRRYCEEGWPGVDHPVKHGGQGLPFFVSAAVREFFDRACMAFGMFDAASRGGARVLTAFCAPEFSKEWLDAFATGRWAAAIGISEADAGSDVGRIRTRATPQDDGTWRITGEKMWTSFGDHDMVERIGLFTLARTPESPPGTAGLSLFLVPNLMRGDDGRWIPNGVQVRRLEEKLGLHGSPTCVTGLDDARGWLIGEIGRGLPQLFVMLQHVRVTVAVQGLGVAQGAAQTAVRYAQDRRQGGPPDRPPVPLASHADIQRILLGMVAKIEVLRGLTLEIAIRLDRLATKLSDDDRNQSHELVQWMLPILKAACSEVAFETANDAIQVLGGAGYTREWPVEQWLRDSRMMSIAEGSSGIQALDLLHRRLWRKGPAGIDNFLSIARTECADAEDDLRAKAEAVFARLERCSNFMLGLKDTPKEAEAGAKAFLDLAVLAATSWIAVRLARLVSSSDRVNARLSAAGRFWLASVEAHAARADSEARAGADRLQSFEAIT